ncbi:hypothetical protein GCM10025876_03220 [Demequina litorisediminis]|uniref:Pyruvate dehydrogenase E1 component n=1 Tax=Demequina litorisediminis TaxID=1849022 RepID=A0ABQ6I8G4_9MICO|nr:hypothetical protein GCM10025876_03220 [Demequina litorisediminis]
MPGDYATLGADGFGFSDTRAAARRYFKIDGPSTAVKVLQRLAAAGQIDRHLVQDAINRYEPARCPQGHVRQRRWRRVSQRRTVSKPALASARAGFVVPDACVITIPASAPVQ